MFFCVWGFVRGGGGVELLFFWEGGMGVCFVKWILGVFSNLAIILLRKR